MEKLLRSIESHSLSFIPRTVNGLIFTILNSLNFNLTNNQYTYLSHLEQNRFSVCLKPRQVGETTLTAAHILALFIEGGKDVLIISPNSGAATEIIKLLRIMMDKLGYEETSRTVREIHFNGHKIISTFNAHGIRHEFDIVYISEAAHINNLEVLYYHVIGVLCMSDSRVIINSTPNGDNFFHQIYSLAQDNGSRFKPFRLRIEDNPIFNNENIEILRRQLHPVDVTQEIDGEFVIPTYHRQPPPILF